MDIKRLFYTATNIQNDMRVLFTQFFCISFATDQVGLDISIQLASRILAFQFVLNPTSVLKVLD
jgi:hypothetical protein